MKPEIWVKDTENWAHVYPSGDVYYKDRFSTRSMHMFGDYEKAIAFLTESGYRKEVK